MLFSRIEKTNHEQVTFFYDPVHSLKAIVAIHNTTLGPALGGCRLLPYQSEEDALEDVLKLSRGMTYKAACANLSLGGGKAIIIASPEQKTESFFRAYGRFIHSLNGRYITAEDMNTNLHDMDTVKLETPHVVGVSEHLGGSGDPGIMTAYGVFYGLQTTVAERLQRSDLKGLKILIEGTGAVGYHLCSFLIKERANVFVTDIDPKKTERIQTLGPVTVVSREQAYDCDIDVFAPCAVGASLNEDSIRRLKAKVVAGSANNQLKNPLNDAKSLKEKGILYAPDYVINAGGLINVANELDGYKKEKAISDIKGISNTLSKIFKIAQQEGITTHEASEHYAEKRLKEAEKQKTTHLQKSSSISASLHS